jgi:hypothetical protein
MLWASFSRSCVCKVFWTKKYDGLTAIETSAWKSSPTFNNGVSISIIGKAEIEI